MSPRHEPEAVSPPGSDGEGFTSSRRIAGNALARLIGEVVAKAASIAFYIAIARELGEANFGDFIFGLSLSTVVLSAAGFGTDELLARNIAREPRLVHHMLVNVLTLRSVLLIGLLGLVMAIVTVGGYPAETRLVVLLIGTGVALEILTGSVQAVFQASEQMKYTSVTLIVQRCFTAGLGITALALGGTLTLACAIFAVGGAVGLLTAAVLLRARVATPDLRIDRRLWTTVLRAGAPLGIAVLLFTALLKVDATLLGFLKDNVEVGEYGAAYRLVEATMFLTWAMGGAMLPWFSRQEEVGTVSIARGYELGLKAITVVLLPIGIVYAMFAEPIIDLVYGQGFDGAVTPLVLLGAMTVLFGINGYASIVLIARNRPGDFARPAAAIVVQNVIFNLILIPRYGAEGAAFNAVLSGVLLAVAALWAVRRVTGSRSLVRALVTPAAAAGTMALVIALAGATIPAAAAGLAAYAASFALIERVAFPGDFELYAGMLRGIRSRRLRRAIAEPRAFELG